MSPIQTTQSIYRTLDPTVSEIRVIKLQQGSAGEEIRCTLETVSLDDRPKFHALSYVWGKTGKGQINISGTILSVTPSLATVLENFRNHHYDALELHTYSLWIDAVCINQADFGERAQQVRLMEKIYSQALNVLVWIGEGDGFSDYAIDWICDETFRASSKDLKYASGTPPTRAPTETELRIASIVTRNLETRRYWTRAWILQEFVLATQDPVIFCGSRYMFWRWYEECDSLITLGSTLDKTWFPAVEFDWDTIVSEVPWHEDYEPQALTFTSSRSHRFIRGVYQEARSVSLADALADSFCFAATDPRDLVYGVLGLVPQHEALKVHVDYEKPPERVFTDVMTTIWTSGTPGLTAELIPRLISAGWAHDTSKVPSWVPDVLDKTQLRRADYSWVGGAWKWRPETQADIHVDGSVLAINAIQFDSIAETMDVDFNHGWGTPFRRGKAGGDLEVDIEPLQKIEAMVQRGLNIPIPDSSRLAPFLSMRDEVPLGVTPLWSVLTAWGEDEAGFGFGLDRYDYQIGTDNDGWLPGIPRKKYKLWEILLGREDIPEDWKMACPPELRNNSSQLKEAVLTPILKAIRKKLHQKRVFTTRCGFLGVGTKYVEAGDVITLIAGMTMFYVLRPFRDGYRIVGLAELSNLMDWDYFGEAMGAGTLQEERVKIY